MDSETSLQALIESAQQGDGNALDELVQRCEPRLSAVIRSHLAPQLKQKLGVEDLVQETFLEAWRSLGSFAWQGESAFWAWLGALARGVIHREARRFRAQKRAAQGEVSLAHRVRSPSGSSVELVELLRKSCASPSTALRRDERFQRLRHALSTLSPDHRKVIFLARVQELSIQEVSRRMGRSPDATSVLLFRALVKLQEAFGSTESFGLPDRRLDDGGSRNGDDERL